MKNIFTLVLVIISINFGSILKDVLHGDATALDYLNLCLYLAAIVLFVIRLWERK